MSLKHCFDYYTLRVRRSHSELSSSIRSFGETEQDLFLILNSFLHGLDDFIDDEDSKTLLIKEDPTSDSANTQLYGFINGGGYGVPKDIFHRETRGRTHRMSSEEGDLLRFFYLFHIPSNSTTGALIIHSIGNNGVFSPLKMRLKRFFQESVDGNFILEIDPVHLNVVAAEEADLRELDVFIYERPPATETARTSVLAPKRKAIAKFSLDVGQRRGLLARLLRSQDARQLAMNEIGQFVQIPRLDDFVVEVKARVKMGNLNKSLNVQKRFQYKTSIDVTNDLSFEEGQPTLESLLREARESLRTLRSASIV